jgi:DMSO/TMAO reductase YedYZ molybdopterin-dependent catalytic subunit
MSPISRGFHGRHRESEVDKARVPPGQYVTTDFPVLSAGPTPQTPLENYTTNLPIADIMGGQAWVAFGYDGQPLQPEHGGPARLLVPHLYFWKSAKWVRGLELLSADEPGFWERYGYNNYGDPWREQRYAGD